MSTNPGPLLQVSGLTTLLRSPTGEGFVRVVDDVSFGIGPGEIVGLVGESGCGKTMTARSILRLLPPGGAQLQGSVEFQGRDLLELSEPEMRALRGRHIAMVPQNPMSALNPVMPVGKQITEVLRLHRGMPRREARRRARELLDAAGVPDALRRMDQYQHELSGGLRQRVMIALAVSCEPSLLIADESTTALDVTTQAQILELIRTMARNLGTAALIITHDLGVVADLCERVVVMYAGQVVEAAPAVGLYSNPQMPYTSALLSSRDLLLPRGKLSAIEGQPPAPVAVRDSCAFEPRCPHARPVCKKSAPALLPREDEHVARCWATEPSGWQRVSGA